MKLVENILAQKKKPDFKSAELEILSLQKPYDIGSASPPVVAVKESA